MYARTYVPGQGGLGSLLLQLLREAWLVLVTAPLSYCREWSNQTTHRPAKQQTQLPDLVNFQ